MAGTVSSRSQTSGRGDVVGQVGDEDPRRPVAAGEQAVPVQRHGVGLDDGDAGSVGQHLAQRGGEATIDLDRRHEGTGLGQGQRQRTEPGTDLDDPVARSDPGQVGDAPHGVRVDDEVLAEVAHAGPDPGS